MPLSIPPTKTGNWALYGWGPLENQIILSCAECTTQAATFIQRAYKARALQWEIAVRRAQRAHERHIVQAKLDSAGKLQVGIFDPNCLLAGAVTTVYSAGWCHSLVGVQARAPRDREACNKLRMNRSFSLQTSFGTE